MALKPPKKQTYLFRARSFIAKHGVLLVIRVIISGVNVPPDFHLSPSFPYVETKTAGYKSPLPATLPLLGHASQLCTG